MTKNHYARLLCLCLLACEGDPSADPHDSTDVIDSTVTDSDEPVLVAEFSWSKPTTCWDPHDDFHRLVQSNGDRGIDLVHPPESQVDNCVSVPGGVVAQDMDGDGDFDLLFHKRSGFPYLYENDGHGQFTAHDIPVDVSAWGRDVYVTSAVDLDGDNLPEVAVSGQDLILVSANLGNLEFGDFEVLYDKPEYPRACRITMAWGDLDRDGDLDLLNPGLDGLDTAHSVANPPLQDEVGTTDLLFLNNNGNFELTWELQEGGAPGLSLLGLFSDRDGDGDLDVLLGTDRQNDSTAFYRNDLVETGTLSLIDDADFIGFTIKPSAMGAAVADINGDGWLDYCIADNGVSQPCMVSDALGNWYESSGILGTEVDQDTRVWLDEAQGATWTGWSVEFADLDNDSWLDLAMVGGPTEDPTRDMENKYHPDQMWRGMSDGTFQAIAGDIGFTHTGRHYGMATADLDGDGYLELVVGNSVGAQVYWQNRCGSGHWLEIEPVGIGLNVEAFGARAMVTVGERTHTRELQNLRTAGQSPSRFHFGLGEATNVDRIVVRWPDGAESVAENVPVNTVVTVRHPDTVDVLGTGTE